MNQDNRKRALAEVVSLEGWHKGFTATRRTADLHVDVTFAEGRIGEDPASDVRFKMRLKRAEVVVIIPPTEPASVDAASVSRDTPQIKVRATETRTLRQNASGGGELAVSASLERARAELKAQGGLSTNRALESAIRISEESQAMRVTQMRTADGDHAWVIEPVIGDALDGKPWNAVKRPRLKVKDTRLDRTKGIEPSIRVELRCRREDLEITNVTLKDAKWTSLATDPFGRNKTLTAEAVIRTRLFQAGLLTGDIDDPYARMTLCAIIAESQG
jgi:hypothetical protein